MSVGWGYELYHLTKTDGDRHFSSRLIPTERPILFQSTVILIQLSVGIEPTKLNNRS